MQEELWKLIELDSENERTGVENVEELQGDFFSRENPSSFLSKREKLFQLLQKLPSRKKSKVRRRCKTKRGLLGKSSKLCGSKNTQKPSLGREMRRFADLFEFHRQKGRVKPKQPKRPTTISSSSSFRARGARKAGKKSVPQKVKTSCF